MVAAKSESQNGTRKSEIRTEEIKQAIRCAQRRADTTGVDTVLTHMEGRDLLVTQATRSRAANREKGSPYGADYLFTPTPSGNHVRLVKARILTHQESGPTSSRAELTISDCGETTQRVEQKSYATCWRLGERQLRVKSVFLTEEQSRSGKVEIQVFQGKEPLVLDLADFFSRAGAAQQLGEVQEFDLPLQQGGVQHLNVSLVMDGQGSSLTLQVSTATDQLVILYPLPVFAADNNIALVPQLIDKIMNALHRAELPRILYPYIAPDFTNGIRH